MPTYDTSTGLRALEGSNPISEIDAGFLALAQDIAARLPTLVTSLPGSPFDGQEIYYLAPVGGVHVVWHLRYRAGSTSPYKWEFVGGSSLYDQASAAVSTSSTGYIDLGGPGITTPLAGDYLVEFGAQLESPTPKNAAGAALMSFVVGGVAATDADALQVRSDSTSIPNPVDAACAGTRSKPALAPGTALAARYRSSASAGAAGLAYFGKRYISARPIRVG